MVIQLDRFKKHGGGIGSALSMDDYELEKVTNIKSYSRNIHIFPFVYEDENMVIIDNNIKTKDLPKGFKPKGEVEYCNIIKRFCYYLQTPEYNLLENSEEQIAEMSLKDLLYTWPYPSTGSSVGWVKYKDKDYLEYLGFSMLKSQDDTPFSSIADLLEETNRNKDTQGVEFDASLYTTHPVNDNSILFIETCDHRFYTESQRKYEIGDINDKLIYPSLFRKLIDKHTQILNHNVAKHIYLGELDIMNKHTGWLDGGKAIIEKYMSNACESCYFFSIIFDITKVEFIYDTETHKFNFVKNINRTFENDNIYDDLDAIELFQKNLVKEFEELAYKINERFVADEPFKNLYIIFKITNDYVVLIIKEKRGRGVYGIQTPIVTLFNEAVFNYVSGMEIFKQGETGGLKKRIWHLDGKESNKPYDLVKFIKN